MKSNVHARNQKKSEHEICATSLQHTRDFVLPKSKAPSARLHGPSRIIQAVLCSLASATTTFAPLLT